MLNISQELEGNTLILKIDLAKKAWSKNGLTKSGESHKVASTNGNVTLDGGYKLGVNVYLPKTA